MTSGVRFAALAASFAWVVACSGAGSPGIEDGDGGNDGGTRDGGWSGPALDAGATPDASEPLECDDHNPCTQDRVEGGQCAHAALPNGTPCSDGLRCTGEDRCESGVCHGADLPPHVVPRGTFFGYGAPPNEEGTPLVGLAEFVSDTDLLFAEPLGSHGLGLSLVRASATGLERLDARTVDVDLVRYHNGQDWSDRLATFFVPLGSNRAVLVGSSQRLEVFDTGTGKIESKATFALSPSSEPLIAGVGRGLRFHTCSLHVIHTWEIDPSGAIERVGSMLAEHDCVGLSLSAGGTELLVASTKGIDRVDVSDPHAIIPMSGFASGRAFWRVDANADFIVGQRLGLLGAISDIEVYRRADLEADPASAPAATFVSTGPTAVPSSMPLGFALRDDDIAVEWIRNDGTETAYVTELRALPGSAPQARSFVHRRLRDRRLWVSPVPITRGGRHLVVPPWRTVLRDDAVQDTLLPLTGAEQAGFEVVSPLGTDRLTALSALSRHEVDLHDPDAPTVTSTPLPTDVAFVRWEPNGPEPLTAPFTLPAGLFTVDRPAPASCFARAPSGALGLAGTVTVPSRGYVVDVGRGMLQLDPAITAGQFDLRWFEAPPACDGRTLTAKVDGRLDLHPGSDLQRMSFEFAADRSGGPNAVLAELRRKGDDPFVSTLVWLEPATGAGWKVAARADWQGTPWIVTELRVHGDLAVFTEVRSVYIAKRSGTKIDIVASRTLERNGAPEHLGQILRFDGELVYVATREPVAGVIVLRARDLAILARFDTHGVPQTLTEVGDRVVFGSANAIDIADVVCPR